MTTNGENRGGRPEIRAVAAVVSDALFEHEAWLRGWQRTIACGLPAGGDVLDEETHLHCGLGRWLLKNGGGGTPGAELLRELDRAHRELHEAARHVARRSQADERIPAGEYDAVMDAATAFRDAARRIRDVHASSEGDEPSDDAMAELQGRLTMLSELERERDRALRTGTAMSLMMVRPEGMDEVESAYGNSGLDRVVASFATRLFGLLRPYDGIYRYGRNDFMVCLPGTTGDQARNVADRLIEVISGVSVVLPDDTELSLRAGFGIAAIDSRSPVQETLEHAVRASEMANSRGGDPVVVWTPGCEN